MPLRLIFVEIAIPVELLQATSDQPIQSATVTQNVILKTLPNGSICIIDANQFINNETAATASVTSEKAIEQIETASKSVVDQRNINNSSDTPKLVMLKTPQTNKFGDSTTQSHIRFLKYKVARGAGHIKINQTKKETFKCKLCGAAFEKMLQYRKHVEAHRNSKKFKCEQCSASYNVEDNLKLHMAMHAKGDPTCPICNRKFQRLASLKAHLILHQVEETYNCTECTAEYEEETELNKHMENHKKKKSDASDNVLPLICSFCNYLFDDPREYKQHVSFHMKMKKLVLNGKRHRRRPQGNKEFPHKCDVCRKSFSKYCLLERHVRIHSGEKPFVCNICERGFAQKGTLQIHYAKHTGIKPYKCTLCPAKFGQKGNLRVHVEKTHTAPVPGEKVYKCTLCTCIFKKVASLNGHITKVHAGEKEDEVGSVMAQLKELEKQAGPKTQVETNDNITSEFKLSSRENPSSVINNQTNVDVGGGNGQVKYVKLADSSLEGTIRRYVVKQRKCGDIRYYICSYCGKEFKKPSDLIRHIRVHTREKPFKCKQCGQAFALKSTLLTHVDTHIGKREYQCIICSSMFTSLRTLNVHIRKHDKGMVKNSQHYLCSACNKVFYSMTKAKLHIAVHNSKGEDNISDTTPSTEPSQINVVMKPPMLETVNGLLPVPPPKSKFTYAGVENNKVRPHKCHICNAAFIKPVHLKRHVLTHSGIKMYQCDTCSRSFSNTYALKEHMKFHSGVKNYCCKICNKRFVTNAILKRHLTTHSTIKPYVCPYCKKHFKTVSLCRKHINIHKRDINIQFHALNETGEIANLEDGDTAKIIDLTDTLVDDPFDVPVIESASKPTKVIKENIVEKRSSLEEQHKRISKPKSVSKKTVEGQQSALTPEAASKLLFTDEMGNVISPSWESLSPETISEIQNVLSFGQISVNQNENIIEKSATSELDLASEDIVSDTGIDGNPQLTSDYPAVYINCDSSTLYNAYISQLRNDPLLVSDINELQESNILFSIDPVLNQSVESHNFEALIPNAFNTDIHINNLNLTETLSEPLTNIISNVTDDSSNDKTAELPSISEINKKCPPLNLNSFINNTLYYKIDDEIHKSVLNPDSFVLNKNSVISLNESDKSSLDVCNIGYGSDQAGTLLSAPLNIINSEQCLNMAEDIDNALLDSENSSPLSASNVVDISCCKCNKFFSTLEESKRHRCSRFKQRLENVHILRRNTRKKQLDFQEEQQSEEHVETHKDKKVAENNCTYCSKTFKKRSDLIRHLRTHTGEKPFTCVICDKSFSLKSTLDSHSRTHNPGGNKTFNCSVCNSYFSSKSSLKVHTLLHTGVKPYQCVLCLAQFRTPGHRKSHMIRHLKGNDFKKDNHSKASKLNNLLASIAMEPKEDMIQGQDDEEEIGVNDAELFQLHMKDDSEVAAEANQTIHLDPLLMQQLSGVLLQDGTEKLSSPFLQLDIDNEGQVMNIKSMPNNDANIDISDSVENSILNDNMLIDKKVLKEFEELVKKNKTTNADFECDICHKKYSSKSVLKKHRKIHGVTNDFMCSKCVKGFDSQEALESHLKLHSGYRPYSCHLCANSFSQEGSLKTHLKRIHTMAYAV